jgi:hypothetical protein
MELIMLPTADKKKLPPQTTLLKIKHNTLMQFTKFTSFIGHQAYRFTGKICVHLTVGGELVNKVMNFPAE